MDKILFCCLVVYLSLIRGGCVQGDLDLNSLKERILSILKKQYEEEKRPSERVNINSAPVSNRELVDDFDDEDKTHIQQREWINYAKEDEVIAQKRETDQKIADLESQLNKDYCADSPCLNYGDCVNRLRGYDCQCKPGFVGPVCQIEIGGQATEVLSVSNGGLEGDWYDFEMCPAASFATGFRIKLESDQGFGDDTAMNGIELQCRNVMTDALNANISSGEGVYGDWKEWQMCPEDYYLVTFQMKVEGDQGSSDDSSVNGVTMDCRGPAFKGEDIKELTGPLGSEGSWGSMSGQCPSGQAICGVATRVESPQGGSDDSGLNDIHFKCCYWW